MMVEAGGSENAFYYYDDGGEEGHRRSPRRRAAGLQGVDQGIDRTPTVSCSLRSSRTHGEIVPMKWTPVLDYTPEIFEAVEKFSTEAMKPAVTISAKAERNAAVDEVTADRRCTLLW